MVIVEQSVAAVEQMTVILNLVHRMPGTRVKADISTVETKADKELLRLTKDVLGAESYKAIRAHKGDTAAQMRAWSLPSMLRNGMYLMPLTLVEKATQYLEKRQVEYLALVQTFMAEYRDESEDGIIPRARRRLADQFDESNYPDSTELENMFGISWRLLTFSTPTKLRSISRQLYEAEKQKAVEAGKELLESVRVLLRAEMKKLVDHMVDMLTPRTDGKRRGFHDTLTENLAEFLETFEHRNIVKDDDLTKLAGKAADLLKGVDVELLREDDDVRKSVHDDFEKLKGQLDKLVAERPKRAISFTDEE
jgi:hypothetical protein